MRGLVQEIDSYAELIVLEITNNPNVMEDLARPQFSDPNAQPATDMTLVQQDRPQDHAA